jgi:hypothetical protein
METLMRCSLIGALCTVVAISTATTMHDRMIAISLAIYLMTYLRDRE